VDVVVRDKKGNPVTDLVQTDFELYEDKVQQEIGAVTMVGPTVSTPSGPATRTGASRPAGGTENIESSGLVSAIRSPNFIALVFDRLTPEARALAYQGALAYLDTAKQDDFAGVFLIDQSVHTIQTYTTDRTRLRQALEEAASRATSGYGRDSARVKAGLDLDPTLSPTAGAESPGSSAVFADPNRSQMSTGELIKELAGGDPSEQMLMRMAARMERSYEEMVRDQQGYATTNSLFAIVDSLGLLPGRKTVVFFAESLALPPNVLPRFDAVVAAANRFNVSVYSIDAAGLRVHSTQSATSREIGSLGVDSAEASILPDDGTGGARLKGLEQNEDALRKDPNVSLRILAERTGGFLINNTNDLARGFRKIDADRRFHYMLTYTPKKAEFNGEWRTLTVKVKRPGVTVRHRTGYLAVRSLASVPVLAYEGPALAALDTRPLPRQVPLRATALGLLTRSGEPRVAVVVAPDPQALTFKENSTKDAFVTDFAVVARIKDAKGEVVRKASEPYRLGGRIADVERVRRAEILFYRQPELPPGDYMLEAAVHDAIADTSGARYIPFTVEAPAPGGLLVSSLILVARTEPAEGIPADDTNPLVSGDLLLYPRFGEAFHKGTDNVVSLFFRMKMPTGATAPSATLVLLKNGQPAASVPIQLAAPNAQGVIDHAARLPLESLPVGDYVLRLVVQSGGEPITREAPLRVVE
jgi:VWFA-related protein